MNTRNKTTKRRGTLRTLWLVVVLAGGIGTLAGCSSVPDAVNPVEWYRGVKGWFGGDDKTAAERKPVPGAEKPYPSLATVPEPPKQVSTADERKQAARSLAADREAARYTDEQIRRQTDNPAAAPGRPEGEPRKPAAAPPAAPSATPAAGAAPEKPSAPSAASRAVVSGPIPAVPAAPPPPPVTPQVATAAPTVPPPPIRRPARNAPDIPLVFGPPPADIAAVQGTDAAPAPSPGYARTPSRAPTRALPVGRRSQLARTYAPTSPFSPRFPAGVPFVPEGGEAAHSARLATIYFGNGSARLTASGRAAIRRAVAAFREQGGTLVVVGHASSRTRDLDPVRHELANFSISLDRANAVAREIIRLGVDPSLVRVSAVSDTQPVYYEVMPSGEAGNRRAEILIEN